MTFSLPSFLFPKRERRRQQRRRPTPLFREIKKAICSDDFFFAKLSFSQKESGGGSNVAAPPRSSFGYFSSHVEKKSNSVATLFGFVTLDVAGFFVVATVTKFLEGAFFVEFLFQPAQSAVDELAFFDAYFSLHDFHPLFVIYGCFRCCTFYQNNTYRRILQVFFRFLFEKMLKQDYIL